MNSPKAEQIVRAPQPSHSTTTPLSILRDNLRHCTFTGINGIPIMMLSIPGSILIAALLSELFGLSPSTYGLIVSLPLWFNFLQVLITPLLSQRWDAKRLCLISAWVHLGAFALLTATLPFIPRHETSLTLAVFFVGFSIISAAVAVSGVTWNGWMQDIVPPRLRGKYFGKRNQLIQASTVAFMLCISGVTALLEGSLFAYLVLFGIALIGRVFSLISLHRTVTPAHAPLPPRKSGERLGWVRQLKILHASPGVVPFIVFASLMGFSLNLFGPFQPIFMYEELELSVSRANWIFLFGTLGAITSMPVWGRLLDRHGNIPVMIVSLGLGQLFALTWCIVDKGSLWLLYISITLGSAVGAGYGLGSFALMLKLMPSHVRAMGLALFTSLSSLAAAMAPPLGGYLISWAKAQGFEPLSIYHAAFLIAPVLSIIGCLVLRSVQEAQAARVGDVVSAMRNVRTLASVLGLPFFMDQVFFRKNGKPRRK